MDNHEKYRFSRHYLLHIYKKHKELIEFLVTCNDIKEVKRLISALQEPIDMREDKAFGVIQ